MNTRAHRTFGLMLAALSALAATAGAQSEQGCLRNYVLARSNPAESLQILRDCTNRFPDSAALNLTLARRLVRDAGGASMDTAARAEAVAAFERAGAVDPAQLSEDWLTLARLHDEAGRPERSLEALGKAVPYLPNRKARDGVQDRRWELSLELGDDATALEVWDSIRFRRGNDADALLTAGRLYVAAGDAEKARYAFEQALELRPDAVIPSAGATRPGAPPSGDAGAPLCRLMIADADRATQSDRKTMLDACAPMANQLGSAELEVLLDAAVRVYRHDQATNLARMTLARNPGSATAHLVLAEQGLRELLRDRRWGPEDGPLLDHARRSLDGRLPTDREARAHAILGTALTYRALTNYRSGGSAASGRLVTRTKAAFREALGHLDRAQSGGEPVDGEIGEVRAALRQLGVMDSELGQRRQEARVAACESLGRQARQQYEVGRPVSKTARRSSRLTATAGSTSELATLGAGSQVKLLDARWTGDGCRCRVKTGDGTTGWVPLGTLD